MDRPLPAVSNTRRVTSTGFSGRHRWLSLFLVIGLVCCTSGCQIVIGVLMILRGFPKEDADFKTKTGQAMEGNRKKVVVLCTSPEKSKRDHVSLDADVIAEVSRQMKAHEVKVIDAHDLLTWIDDNGGELQENDLTEIGRKFDVDYLIQIEMTDFSIRDPSSPGLYRGNVIAKIRVFARQDLSKNKEKAKSKGEADTLSGSPLKHIYTKPYKCTFPLHQPVPTDHESAAIFSKRFLERLGIEISQLFYAHRLEDEL
jgi:hypothetical protein